jgi:K+-sensing histidine kinase KdpD
VRARAVLRPAVSGGHGHEQQRHQRRPERRLCWAVVGTLSGKEELAACARKASCASCDFFNLVKEEEGQSFHLLKLARGVISPRELHQTISQVESLMAIHERLHSHFDLDETIREITQEARKVTGAQRSVVLLLQGKPPALHGEFMLKGEPHKVVVNVDETSATGYAALHNEIVNLRNIYDAEPAGRVPVFNRVFDQQCGCLTNSLLAVPIHDPEGSVIGVITVANARKGYFSTDDQWFMENYATELALAVEKQKAIQQTVSALRLASIGETVAAMSHCIKNIAQALRTGSHVIKRAIRSGKVEDVKAAWDILDRHIERLADLSMDILAYDPLVKKYSEKGSLNELVEHVLDLFKEEARARAVEVRFQKGNDVDPAKFDPLGIYRCLVNLISNALDACPLSDGMITVSTERTNKTELMITVADNGRGMDEKTKAGVFELFRTSKLRKGTGLGLPTVADIVDKHHGRIELDTKPGKGTTFRLFIRENVALA